MSDTLTFEDLMILRQPFAANEHEFRGGFTYITEQAVTTRIEDVDPAWTFTHISTVIRDNQAVVTMRMTIKGVSRDGIGMQTVMEKTGEAEKGAATDALKRCARLFGVGRYLLDLPSGIDNMNALAKWLADSGKAPQVDRETGEIIEKPATPKGKTDIPEAKVGLPVVKLNDAYVMVKNVMERPTFDVIIGTLDLHPAATPQTIAKAVIAAHKAREKLAS